MSAATEDGGSKLREEWSMSLQRFILMRAFGRPQGLLGRIGGLIMARTNRSCAQWVRELLDPQSRDRVLEIGCGPGVAIELFAQRASLGYVAGVDPSREMLAQAKGRNEAAIARGVVDLRQGSAERLPFADEDFDKALAINSAQLWPDAAAGLREIARTLKPGGRVALAFTPYSGYSPDDLAEKLAAAGFAEARRERRDGHVCALATRP
jgi:ubiquinone/menaquinone biosynthesis C-methylase UbiE